MIGGSLFFFGLGLIGISILVLASFYARTKFGVVLSGCVAAIFLALESLLLGAMAGIGSATSGEQTGYHMAGWFILFSVVSLLVYFFVAPLKFIHSKPPSGIETIRQKKEDEPPVRIKQKY